MQPVNTSNYLKQQLASGSMLQGGGGGIAVSSPQASSLQGSTNTGTTVNPMNYIDPNIVTTGSTNTTDNNTTLDAAAQAAAEKAAAQAANEKLLLSKYRSLDDILANKQAQAEAAFNKAQQAYDDQHNIDSQRHTGQVTENEQGLTKRNHAALLSAVQLAQSLRRVLGSMHALDGTGGELANRKVEFIANRDLGQSKDVFDTNAKGIQTNWADAMAAYDKEREDAKEKFQANKQNNESDVLSSRQSILEQLANLFGAGTTKGDNYAAQAAGLNADIVKTTRPVSMDYKEAASLYSPTQLQAYLSGTSIPTVSTGDGSPSTVPINSPLYASDKRKEQLA